MVPAGPPAPDTGSQRRSDGLLRVAALVVVVFGLQAAQGWLLPICFALLFAVLASFPLRWLRRIGLPRPLGFLLSLALVAVAVWWLGRALLAALIEFGRILPTHEHRLGELLDQATSPLRAAGIEVTRGDLIASVEPRAWLGFVQRSVGGALGLLSTSFLIAVAMAFLLWEHERLHRRLSYSFGAAWDEAAMTAMLRDLQRYMAVKTGTSALTGGLVALLCMLLGMPSAALFGLLAFVLNFVPIVGSIVAAVPALVLALVDPALGAPTAIWLAVGYLVLNNAISNLLEPILMGRSVGLPAFAILLSLVFWGWLWGIGGMFLAVPLTIVVGWLVTGRDDLPLLRALVGRDPH